MQVNKALRAWAGEAVALKSVSGNPTTCVRAFVPHVSKPARDFGLVNEDI